MTGHLIISFMTPPKRVAMPHKIQLLLYAIACHKVKRLLLMPTIRWPDE
jgi:hypothetical protein